MARQHPFSTSRFLYLFTIYAISGNPVARLGLTDECRKVKHLWAQSPPYHFTRSLILTPSVSATASTVEMRGSDVR